MKIFSLSRWILTFGVAAVCLGAGAIGAVPAYLNKEKSWDERVVDTMSRMTFEEKVAMCHGSSKNKTFLFFCCVCSSSSR